MANKSIAIMQPYIFPYIGYFHLMQASNLFVFYDDVNYIKRGWINRNRILNQDRDLIYTVPVAKSSHNKLINQISPVFDDRWKNKFYNTLLHNYKKAPFYDDAIEIVMSPFARKYSDIADLAIESITAIMDYLEIPFEFTKSSICSPGTKGLEKGERLIELTKELGFRDYVNVPAGKQLYSKEYFQSRGVNLYFVKSHPVTYTQYNDRFIPDLSIIDVVMFCGKNKVKDLMSSYSVE